MGAAQDAADARIAEQGVFKYVLLRVSAPDRGSRLLVRGTLGLQWHQDNLDAAQRELAPLLPHALVRPLRPALHGRRLRVASTGLEEHSPVCQAQKDAVREFMVAGAVCQACDAASHSLGGRALRIELKCTFSSALCHGEHVHAAACCMFPMPCACQSYGLRMRQVEPLGGGRIDVKGRAATIYGYSQAFGQAPHDISAALVRRSYPLLDVSVSHEGY